MNDIINIAKNVIQSEINGLIDLKNSINYVFIDIVDAIYQTKGRVVLSGMGKSGHIARKITATLASTGTPAIFIHPAEASHGDLGMIAKSDIVLLLSNSGESTELTCIIDYCKRFKIKIIGITGKVNSSLAKISDIAIIIPSSDEASEIGAPTTSTTMMLALGDAIAIALQHKHNFTCEDFKIFHPGGNIGAKLLKIKDLMHTADEIPIVNYNENALNSILTITQKRLGCAGVVNQVGNLIGIITDGDLRRHIHLDLKNCKAIDFMTHDPITITEEYFAVQALLLMHDNQITNLFIVNDKKPIGVIHLHDLVKAGVV